MKWENMIVSAKGRFSVGDLERELDDAGDAKFEPYAVLYDSAEDKTQVFLKAAN